jgi:hypothetical protein
MSTVALWSSEGAFMGYTTTEALADVPDLTGIWNDLAAGLDRALDHDLIMADQPKGPSEPTQPVPLTPPRPEPRPDPNKRKQKG